MTENEKHPDRLGNENPLKKHQHDHLNLKGQFKRLSSAKEQLNLKEQFQKIVMTFLKVFFL